MIPSKFRTFAVRMDRLRLARRTFVCAVSIIFATVGFIISVLAALLQVIRTNPPPPVDNGFFLPREAARRGRGSYTSDNSGSGMSSASTPSETVIMDEKARTMSPQPIDSLLASPSPLPQTPPAKASRPKFLQAQSLPVTPLSQAKDISHYIESAPPHVHFTISVIEPVDGPPKAGLGCLCKCGSPEEHRRRFRLPSLKPPWGDRKVKTRRASCPTSPQPKLMLGPVVEAEMKKGKLRKMPSAGTVLTRSPRWYAPVKKRSQPLRTQPYEAPYFVPPPIPGDEGPTRRVQRSGTVPVAVAGERQASGSPGRPRTAG